MKNNKLMLLTAIIFSFLAAYGVYWYLDSMEKRLDKTVYVQVIVPKEDIQANTKLTKEMFQATKIPADYVHPQAVTNSEEIDGAIAKGVLMAGEQLLAGKVVKKEQFGEGLAYQIKPGFRAISIPINQVSGVSGLVKPGDAVDIIATIEAEEIISTYLLQNILVLAADNILEREASGANGLERKTLTLEVKPFDAPKLVLASEKGNLQLLLRTPIDSERVNVPGANLRNFIQ